MSHNRYLPNDFAPDASLRLFALPFAGGGAANYFRWRPVMRPAIDVVPIALAGREARIHEPPLRDLRALVGEVADAVEPVIDQPYALAGHSMGAWLALELARELRRRGARSPATLIVAASPAPHRSRSTDMLHRLPDDEFVAEMSRRFDGIPPAIRSNAELLKLLLPAMRADMELLETYEYVDEPPLATDILALGGTEDRAVSATALAEWRVHTTGQFATRLFPGGHFFLFPPAERGGSELPPSVRAIAEILGSYLT
jgi:medium-chain acyl-[acyl-carrier-protein] hydrolase